MFCAVKNTKKGDLKPTKGPIQPTEHSARLEEENKHPCYPSDLREKGITSSYPTDFCSSAASLYNLFLTLQALEPAGAFPELRQLQIARGRCRPTPEPPKETFSMSETESHFLGQIWSSAESKGR